MFIWYTKITEKLQNHKNDKIWKRSERREQEIAKLKGVGNKIFYSRLMTFSILCNWMTSKFFICFFLCLIRCSKKIANVHAINQNKNSSTSFSMAFSKSKERKSNTFFSVRDIKTFKTMKKLLWIQNLFAFFCIY